MTKGLSSQQAAVEGIGDGMRHLVYIPDYTVEAATNLTVVRISVEQYAGALHAALLDRHLRAVDNHASEGQLISPGGHGSDISGTGMEFPTASDVPSPLVGGRMHDRLLEDAGNGECNLVMEEEKSCDV